MFSLVLVTITNLIFEEKKHVFFSILFYRLVTQAPNGLEPMTSPLQPSNMGKGSVSILFYSLFTNL